MEDCRAANVGEVDWVFLVLDDERHQEWDAGRLAEPPFDFLIGADIHFVFLGTDFDGDVVFFVPGYCFFCE